MIFLIFLHIFIYSDFPMYTIYRKKKGEKGTTQYAHYTDARDQGSTSTLQPKETLIPQEKSRGVGMFLSCH